jgi:flagellar export protein FliJ
MSKRSFRLETVLRVRRAQEESARADLARENRQVHAATSGRDRAAQRYREVPVSSGAVAASVFQREAASADLAAATLLDAHSRLSLAEAEAAVALRQWREAAQRVEALERLELRRLEELRAEDARQESASVDDLVTARYIAADRAQREQDGRDDQANQADQATQAVQALRPGPDSTSPTPPTQDQPQP